MRLMFPPPHPTCGKAHPKSFPHTLHWYLLYLQYCPADIPLAKVTSEVYIQWLILSLHHTWPPSSPWHWWLFLPPWHALFTDPMGKRYHMYTSLVDLTHTPAFPHKRWWCIDFHLKPGSLQWTPDNSRQTLTLHLYPSIYYLFHI